MHKIWASLILFLLLLQIPVGAEAQDTLYRNRFGRIKNNIDLRFHNNAIPQINALLKNSSSTAVALGRAEFYFPYFDSVLRAHNLPTDLKYLALASSLLNYEYFDTLDGARGVWHLNYNTARLYDLSITSYVDERRNYKKSTLAFVKAMKDYYSIYKDWSLASAALVSSAIKVNKAIRYNNNSMSYPVISKDLEGLAGILVYRMMAFIYINEFASEHNLRLVPYQVLNESAQVRIENWLSLKDLSERYRIPLSTLRWLNPDYRKDVIPDTETDFILHVPIGFIDSAEAIRSIKYEPYAHFTFYDDIEPETAFDIDDTTEQDADTTSEKIRLAHKVKAGETLNAIARKYNCRVDDIKSWNNLTDGNLKAGQTLYIYAPKPKTGDKGQPRVKTPPKTPKEIIHKVKSGETLSGIAVKYNCSVTEIKRWNNLKNNSIRAGQRLKIKR